MLKGMLRMNPASWGKKLWLIRSVLACSLPSAGDRSNIILRVPRSNHKEQGKFKNNIIK